MALNGYPPSINVCWSKVYYIELLYMYTAAAHMCSIGSLLLLFWMDGLFMLIDSNNNIRERVFFFLPIIMKRGRRTWEICYMQK
jgi:hypothetical protein